jgi:hypothetical protein
LREKATHDQKAPRIRDPGVSNGVASAYDDVAALLPLVPPPTRFRSVSAANVAAEVMTKRH